jgi:hypothetical protein
MADVKTNLRELSVLVGVTNQINNKQSVFDAHSFFIKVKSILPPDYHQYVTNLDLTTFTQELN